MTQNQVATQLHGIMWLYRSMPEEWHIEAMLNGAKNCDCTIIVHSAKRAGEIKSLVSGASTHGFGFCHDLAGIHKPIIWDTGALFNLIGQSYTEIMRLDAECSRLIEENERLRESKP
jgi:hypothetical protein